MSLVAANSLTLRGGELTFPPSPPPPSLPSLPPPLRRGGGRGGAASSWPKISICGSTSMTWSTCYVVPRGLLIWLSCQTPSCCALSFSPFAPPTHVRHVSAGGGADLLLLHSDWRGIWDFLIVAGWPFRTGSGSVNVSKAASDVWPVAVDWLCWIYFSLLEHPHWARKFSVEHNRSVVVLEMSSARACKAHSGLVCVTTWNYRRIMSESSSLLRMAYRRMTSQVFALFTPSFESRSPQAASIAEPPTPTVKLYWAVVQVRPFLRDANQILSRWRAYLVFLSRSLYCAQSRDQ